MYWFLLGALSHLPKSSQLPFGQRPWPNSSHKHHKHDVWISHVYISHLPSETIRPDSGKLCESNDGNNTVKAENWINSDKDDLSLCCVERQNRPWHLLFVSTWVFRLSSFCVLALYRTTALHKSQGLFQGHFLNTHDLHWQYAHR